jgi:25S rRNA (adenine2142-N1)-methyltransferase
MPRTRQRKTPVTTTSPGASTSALHSEDARAPAAKRTRTVIRRFHVLLKRQAQLAAPDGKGKARADERAEIAQEIEALGGLAEYQRMSATGQTAARGGSSAKILVGWLQELALDKRGCPLQ